MCKIPNDQSSSGGLAMVVTSLFVKEANAEDLWKLDTLGITDPIEQKSRKERELATKEHFIQTVAFNTKEKRYEIRLPWTEEHPPLPSNWRIAEKRLQTLTKRLRAENMLERYDAILRGWKEEGIIEEVPDAEIDRYGHYLPHRHLIKESSSTTPVRPIFDASAKDGNAPSLNQCLETGPNLLEMIPSLLLRFRQRRIGLIADIEKAFLQIKVHPDDRDLLRFLWWETSEATSLKIFRHARVVFGVTCSPFLLGAVIEHHLKKALEKSNYDGQRIVQLKGSFYVDNVVTSVDNDSERYLFESDARRVMAEAGFNLRGWEHSYELVQEPGQELTSVLGVRWDKTQDVLSVKVADWTEDDDKVTKRKILSVAHRFFDPIGILCPVLLCPRLLLQRAWGSGINWDTEVNEDIKREFLQWRKELILLRGVSIPRWIHTCSTDIINTELHVFCDASQKAYATAIFLRVETADSIEVTFIASKARVAPLKKGTMPRLELLAAVIGVRLSSAILEGLKDENVTTVYWTDSTTVLAWITREVRWSVFVRNRVDEIRQLSEPGYWRYVPGSMNPADLPSRGCAAQQLLATRWWEGPSWLRATRDRWPQAEISADEKEINDEGIKANSHVVNKGSYSNLNVLSNTETKVEDLELKENNWIVQRFSDYDSMLRLVGWINRFAHNCRTSKESRIAGELCAKEIRRAEGRILRLVQEDAFGNGRELSLRPLKVYRDEQGTFRAQTRIVYRVDAEDFRSPIVLPSQHTVVKRLIMTQHKRHCHAGVQVLLGLLREHYWILRGRRTVRAVLAECVQCRRYDGTTVDAPMAALPENRVRDAAVFEITGIDYAGPLFLKDGRKAWIALFTCAVYRAVHLELVSSLSTEAFLQGLRRFVSRRGRPNVVYSDNGTNFVGAVNALSKVDWNIIARYASIQRIEWKFNPPTAAWWGGWWERLIRLLKQLLRKSLGRASLTYEEMHTILCDCEAVMNSRPLTYVADNDAELIPLSPSLFLRDNSYSEVADLDAVDELSLNKRLKYRLKLKRDLRERFRSEYLGQLMDRAKSKEKYQSLAVGDIVLIGNDNVKRIDWPLGQITQILPDKEGVVRLVRLQTASGELLRPIQRLCPLEMSQHDPVAKVTGATEGNVPESAACSKDIESADKVQVTRSGRVVKIPQRLKF